MEIEQYEGGLPRYLRRTTYPIISELQYELRIRRLLSRGLVFPDVRSTLKVAPKPAKNRGESAAVALSPNKRRSPLYCFVHGTRRVASARNQHNTKEQENEESGVRTGVEEVGQ